MKALICKASTVLPWGGGTAKRKEGSAQVNCSPGRSPEGGLRRSEEQTRLIDSIGEVNL